MSTFGSPGGRTSFSKPSPPERGSFPLDHDAECKEYMTSYLKCIRQARGVNLDECRARSREYLKCRMDKNLMAPDEMKNLGFAGLEDKAAAAKSEQASSQEQQQR